MRLFFYLFNNCCNWLLSSNFFRLSFFVGVGLRFGNVRLINLKKLTFLECLLNNKNKFKEFLMFCYTVLSLITVIPTMKTRKDVMKIMMERILDTRSEIIVENLVPR